MEEKCRECRHQYSCYGNFIFFHADSYIEEIFLNKCKENTKRNLLMLEWIDSKNIYIKYSNLCASSYGNYSKHDATHSVEILDAIVSVLGKDKIQRLNVTDLWLLLHCAYGHDIGMPYTFEEMTALWSEDKKEGNTFKDFFVECLDSDDLDLQTAARYLNGISRKLGIEITDKISWEKAVNKFEKNWTTLTHRYVAYLTTEFIRKSHAKRSGELISKCAVYKDRGYAQVEHRYYKLVSSICMLHTDPDFRNVLSLPKHEWDIEAENCHPRFVAAMLRLGDLLDIDNNRFDLLTLQHYGKLPQLSELHKKKHESIEHIKYTEKVIEITARSENEDVCRLTSDWFGMIKDEVTSIVFNWTDIAPECLGGCTLSKPKTEVYWNDRLFYRVEDCEFKVDKETLIELVIGRNLYKAQFDFLKEYIQNALDAVKMKFWIELQDGNIDYLVTDKEKIKQSRRHELLPFDFESIVFKQYAIDILCSFVSLQIENNTEEFVRIEIFDRGIGIDKECITAISNIGSGWTKRKRYTKYLDHMPLWLKPTGGFGIGMQSGFMITNEVQIETRCEKDAHGRRISLYSNKQNGRIEEREWSVPHIGTKVIVDVPYRWFMDGENYKEYPELKFALKEDDFFNSRVMMKDIVSFVKGYVEIVMGNTLFPINVKLKGSVPETVTGFGTYHFTNKQLFNWQEEEYLVGADSEKLVYIWEKRRGILCRIEPNMNLKRPRAANWYFKGVRVWTDSMAENEVMNIYEYIGNFDIDIMGINVKDCLTVDRNRFVNGFEYMKIADTFAVIYLNYMALTDKFIEGEVTGNTLLACLLAYRYVVSKDRRQNIRNYIDNFSAEEIGGFQTRLDMMGVKYRLGNGKKESSNPGAVFSLCRNLWFHNEIRWTKNELPDLSDVNLKFLHADKGREVEVWELSDSKKNELIPRLRQLLDLIFPQAAEQNGFYYYKEKSKEEEEREVKEKVFAIRWANRRQIFFSKEHYPELYVKRLPFNMEDNVIMEKKKQKPMIISPLPAMYTDLDVVMKLKEKESPDIEFKKMITDTPMYQRLIDWVYACQIEPNKYSRDKIQQAYGGLVDYIYENSVRKYIADGEM